MSKASIFVVTCASGGSGGLGDGGGGRSLGGVALVRLAAFVVGVRHQSALGWQVGQIGAAETQMIMLIII